MAALHLRIIVRTPPPAAPIADEIRECPPDHTLADCLPADVPPASIESVSLHRADSPDTAFAGGTKASLTTPVAVCQQFGLLTVVFVVPEPPPPSRDSAAGPRSPSLMEAVLHGDLAAVRALCPAADPMALSDALQMAVTDGRADLVTLLLATKAGVGADTHGERPLLTAAANGRTEIIALLLDAKADPCVRDPDYERTPLAWAVVGHHHGAVEALVDRRVLDVRDGEGYTPLMLAVVDHQTPIAAVLLGAGAAVDAERADGWTALMLAADRGDAPTATELLRHGADTLRTNTAGQSPVLLAAAKGHRPLLHLLQSHDPAAPAAPETDATIARLLALAENEARLHLSCGHGCHGHP